MKQVTQQDLFDRINTYLESGSDPMADRVMTQPSTRYVHADHFDREQSTVFDRLPLVVGLSDRVRHPGQFFTDDLTGWPLLIVRGDDGILRGFHNSCGHRGARVESNASGCSSRFTCPYHAWSYDSAGTLISIPNADGFADLDRGTRGLVEVPVEERHGFVWTRPTASPGDAVDVGPFLGDLDEELSDFGIDKYTHDRTDVLREPFNWKQVIDGFLETYHLRFLHRTTIGPYLTSNFALFDAFGPHGRMVGLRASFEAMRNGPVDQRDLLPHVAIIYQIFPNTVLVWQGDHFEAWTSFPAGNASAMAARASLLAPPGKNDTSYDAHWDKNWKVLMGTVMKEDFVVARAIHGNNLAGVRSHAVFGRQEAALQHFHDQLEQHTH